MSDMTATRKAALEAWQEGCDSEGPMFSTAGALFAPEIVAYVQAAGGATALQELRREHATQCSQEHTLPESVEPPAHLAHTLAAWRGNTPQE